MSREGRAPGSAFFIFLKLTRFPPSVEHRFLIRLA